MKALSGSLYDYLLFYECAAKDWKDLKSSNEKLNVATQAPGTLMNHINWGVSGTTVAGDSGGNTKCGVTHGTWSSWYTKNAGRYGLNTGTDVNKMDKKGWMSLIDSWWIGCANNACSLVLFQARWGGWSTVNSCLTLLKQHADIPGYSFKTSGDVYSKIADATHAYKNPMDAYQLIRNAHQEYLYNLSAPGKKNSKFRKGWMRREVATFQDDGLYIETGGLIGMTSDSMTLKEWRALCNQQKGKLNGYVKLCSWDNMPSNPEAYDDIDLSSIVPDNGSGGGSNGGSGGGYSARFSGRRNDPHLSASKTKEPSEGLLLGPSFNIK